MGMQHINAETRSHVFLTYLSQAPTVLGPMESRRQQKQGTAQTIPDIVPPYSVLVAVLGISEKVVFWPFSKPNKMSN
jgi:hypothetical protein